MFDILGNKVSRLVYASLACLLLTVQSAGAQQLLFEFEVTSSAQERAIHQQLLDSGVNDELQSLAEQFLDFEQGVTIVYGAEDGPMYDSLTHEISIPWLFIEETADLFELNDSYRHTLSPIDIAVSDVLLHTLLHEIAHAFFFDQQIPILGKEEDAADNLATLMLLYGSQRGDIASINASDMFAFESTQTPDTYEAIDYLDEHSFDLQRYFATRCLVYAAFPERYSSLLDEIDLDAIEERKTYCIENLGFLKRSFANYISFPDIN